MKIVLRPVRALQFSEYTKPLFSYGNFEKIDLQSFLYTIGYFFTGLDFYNSTTNA